MLFAGKRCASLEPPEPVLILLGGKADADPFVGQDMAPEAIVLHPEIVPVQNALPVPHAGDAQNFGQFSGAGGIKASPDENGLGIVLVSGDNIHQPMHAIA